MVTSRRRRRGGFTLIELMVVMAIIGLLMSLAMPRYVHSLDKTRDAVLRHDLRAMRDAIDQFLSDRNRYPASLSELVELRYLRDVPLDPVTESSTTWVLLPPPDSTLGEGIYDVRSGATGTSHDGMSYERL
jgi:prepilin-type N-terminal cleavage/methylation domain-containing protein